MPLKLETKTLKLDATMILFDQKQLKQKALHRMVLPFVINSKMPVIMPYKGFTPSFGRCFLQQCSFVLSIKWPWAYIFLHLYRMESDRLFQSPRGNSQVTEEINGGDIGVSEEAWQRTDSRMSLRSPTRWDTQTGFIYIWLSYHCSLLVGIKHIPTTHYIAAITWIEGINEWWIVQEFMYL